jgi:hypothetical protein
VSLGPDTAPKDQPGLADLRRPLDQEHPTVAGAGVLDELRQSADLDLPFQEHDRFALRHKDFATSFGPVPVGKTVLGEEDHLQHENSRRWEPRGLPPLGRTRIYRPTGFPAGGNLRLAATRRRPERTGTQSPKFCSTWSHPGCSMKETEGDVMDLRTCRKVFDEYVSEIVAVGVYLGGNGVAGPVALSVGDDIDVRVVMTNHPHGQRDATARENPKHGVNLNDVRNPRPPTIQPSRPG